MQIKTFPSVATVKDTRFEIVTLGKTAGTSKQQTSNIHYTKDTWLFLSYKSLAFIRARVPGVRFSSKGMYK